MRCTTHQDNLALNQKIFARADHTNQFDHAWVFDPNVGEVVCRDCGSWARGTIGGCQAKAYGFSYIGDCRYLINQDNSALDMIKQMVAEAEPISREEFETCCELPEGHDADMAQDPGSGYFRSKFDGKPALFYQTSGFEFIYLGARSTRFRKVDLLY
ncbi:hypothetical protein [Geoalkalibacter subterraneus]|uniref:Uncharacterized protein n=1 Tax=Geoalkalibacter subterraneus TaxID=483547 RepID=A0A0B5FL87_9BACT|nr:hypothetical protein [Geoalkalibacter subterraneus]AJF08158.1 hypothetical protein GSUB_16790 [Geoalkalibacter subterraneus]